MIGAPLVWTVTRPAALVGDVAAVEQSLRSNSTTQPAVPRPVDGASHATTTTTHAPGLRFTVSDGTLAPSRPAPAGLRVERIDVDAPINPYGVDRRGDMAVPSNVREVAWYQYGPTPGEPGSAVLAAHVDLASQGAGVFFRLGELEVGDLVEVDYDDGTSQTFRVVARVRYDKNELPLDVIFATDGPPILTLITCGGGFNPSIQSYDSNVVVYAYPVSDSTEAPNIG